MSKRSGYMLLFYGNDSQFVRVFSDAGRSESPYVGSENGILSDDGSPSPAKVKGKKGKRAGKDTSIIDYPIGLRLTLFRFVDDGDFNLKRKRVSLDAKNH